MIELRNVSVSLGHTCALTVIDTRVHSGEWLAVIGPNGGGKTTLLRAVAGLVQFDGTVTLEGVDVRAASRRELARIVALVPQLPETPPALTVAEYVLLGRTAHIGYFATERRCDRIAAARAINRLGLVPLTDRPLGSLSGGERQRVVLARALAQEAPVLLLDEPTSALDLGHQQRVLELVDALRVERRLTVISAMHDLTLAGQYAERVLVLARGSIVADGAPDAVLSAPMVADCYGAEVTVLHDNGRVLVAPRRGNAGGRMIRGASRCGSRDGLIELSETDGEMLRARPAYDLKARSGIGL